MSQFEYVHTASPRKLPFIHSKFKPRSKFAKSFSGCNKFSKVKQSTCEDEADSTRLPRITYNAQDIRDAPPAFGSVRRGTRREYPGFTGNTRILRHNKNSQTSSHAASNGVRNSSRDSRSLDGDVYLEFPSPREHKETGNGPCSSDGRDSNPNYDWSQFHASATRRRDERLGCGHPSVQDTQNGPAEGSESTFKPSELISDMDSLFIGDNEEEKTTEHNPNDVGLNSSEKLADSTRASQGKNHGIRFADNTLFGDGENGENEEAKNDPFAKNFEEKLREIRGKSGVKRDRTRKRLQKKRGEGEMRPLGDLITTKRLQEILSPHTNQGVTIRLHS